MKKISIAVFLLAFGTISFAQENINPQDLPKVFEQEDASTELARLNERKEKLSYRLSLLKVKPVENATEIARIENLISYLDRKIESQQKVLNSEQYAEKNGLVKKEGMTAADYEQLKLKHKDNPAKSTTQITTTLSRYEFEKLPKDRQEKILSMPERYTIID